MGNSSSIYEKAIDLFVERFPTLGLQLGSWSAKKPSKEILPPIHLEREEVFYFWGLSDEVYFACKEWLKKGENQLVFLEDDSGIIASFLQNQTALEILSNPQVHIELFSKKAADIETLANRFPVRRMEFSGFTSKKNLKKIRLEFLRKTALAHGLYMDRLHGHQPFHNFVENLAHLPSSFYANGLKGAFPDVPAVICGAGPSLESTLNTLKTLENKALIIAGGSTLAALSSKGIQPHFGMAIDPNLEEYRRLKNSFTFEVPLLYSTRVHPGIFRTCNGPFGYMRSGIGGLLELWIEEELGLQDPLLGDFLSSETVSVTAICVAFAQFLGCNPILLNGIDMAYTGGARYASGVMENEKIAFEAIDREKSAADRIIRKRDRQGKTVYSAVRWIMESASLSHFAKMHPKVRFINTTTGGIGFKGIPFMPLEEAVLSFEKRDLRAQVFESIQECPMPTSAAEKIEEQMEMLGNSLGKVIESLEILAGEKKGSQALAELELQEEIAALYLFYDIRQILKPGPTFWQKWLELARKYEAMLS